MPSGPITLGWSLLFLPFPKAPCPGDRKSYSSIYATLPERLNVQECQ